ncbi:MAG: hypothetical protein K9G62_03620 [Alphaproteobacteria bacterium]|nr:hypothetical protein [Alphaproteobacteria bacterium]
MGGANENGEDPQYYGKVTKLGEGFSIVCGGFHYEVPIKDHERIRHDAGEEITFSAKATHNNGGVVTGFIPQFFCPGGG